MPPRSRHWRARFPERFATPPVTSSLKALASQGPAALGRCDHRGPEQADRFVEDKGEFVSTTGGVVTLDLKSLLETVTTDLGLPGKLVTKLPAEASSIEVMKSSELEAAQKGVNLLQAAAYVLTALTLLLYVAAVFFAGDRRRATLRAVGFSFIVIGAVVLFARSAGGNAVVDSLSGTASSDDAVRSAYEIGTSLLNETGQSLLIYGIVIVLAAWLAGPTAWATSIRRAITPYLRQPRYAYGGLAALLILLFWWDPVVATHRLVPSLLLIVFAAIGVEALRRQVIREFPDRVQTNSPEGMARDMWERMQEARAARHTPAAAPAGVGATSGSPTYSSGSAPLHESGILSDEELANEKRRIMEGAATDE